MQPISMLELSDVEQVTPTHTYSLENLPTLNLCSTLYHNNIILTAETDTLNVMSLQHFTPESVHAVLQDFPQLETFMLHFYLVKIFMTSH